MAEIHILEFHRDPAWLERAYDMLEQRIEAGEDLGCRIHHIRSLSSSLEVALCDLNRLIAAFDNETHRRLRFDAKCIATSNQPTTIDCTDN